MRRIEPSIVPIRLDKNIAQNITGFSVQYGEDATLMRDVILFLCDLSQNQGQASLFENLHVDIEEFAKRMRYNASNLRRMHPNPKHIDNLKSQKQFELYREQEATDMKFHIFETVFENALYRLLKEPFELPAQTDYETKKINGKNHIFESVSLTQVPLLLNLKYFKIVSKSTRLKGIYDCVLGYEFKRTLFRYFAQLSLSSVVSLRQPKIDALYIYLSSLKDTLASNGKTSTVLSFNYLKRQANISRSDSKKEKQQLILKFKILENTDLGVTLSWLASTSVDKVSDRRVKYVPFIEFNQEDALTPEERQAAKRNFWFQQFCTEVINFLNCNESFLNTADDVIYPITADQDVMRLIMLFILQCREDKLKSAFKYMIPMTDAIMNSYNEVWGSPTSPDYKQRISAMADKIIMLNSITSIQNVFLDVNWYTNEQSQKRIRDASFRVGAPIKK